jgi:radical SAM superfamily enzyme YgiQ (UPF0313 family)|tara:strand:+ start:632 stop:2065 length:1434 start_codon:yes stop_codon:yes gene_type:complete
MKLALISLIRDEFAPPLGLASIATYLKEFTSQYKIRIFDANYDNIFRDVEKFSPDIVGISSMSHYYKEAIDTAQRIKQDNDCYTFIGGVHISSLPNSLSPNFDVGVIGEGEDTLRDLLKLYDKTSQFSQSDLKKINGIIYWNNKRINKTAPRNQIYPLDNIPLIDRDFLNSKYFRKRWIAGEMRKAVGATMLTSRGCPYRCIFCNTSRFWQKLRFNSPERVYTEVKYLIEKYNVEHIQIWDDLFTINRKRLEDILHLIEKGGISKKVTFHCHPRANLMNDRLCKILKSLGVTTINFGFESGSNKMLNYLKGGSVNLEDNQRALILGKKYDFSVVGSLIFGSPGESIQDMEETLEFIDFFDKNGGDNLWHFIMTPFPGTPLWKIAEERGYVSDNMNWDLLRHNNLNVPTLLDDNINQDEFKKIFNLAGDRIYQLRASRKGWLIRKILKDPVRLVRVVKQEPMKAIRTLFYLLSRLKVQ